MLLYCTYQATIIFLPYSHEAHKLGINVRFPQYTFTFRPQWVGRGKHASWNHILQITNTPTAVVRQVVGAPGQQNM